MLVDDVSGTGEVHRMHSLNLTRQRHIESCIHIEVALEKNCLMRVQMNIDHKGGIYGVLKKVLGVLWWPRSNVIGLKTAWPRSGI